MILNSDAILSRINGGTIIINPFKPANLRPCSYLLTLGTRFRKWVPKGELDPWAPNPDCLSEALEASELILYPGDFLLGHTAERLSLSPDIAGHLSTISHLARLGISFVLSSTLVRPGFGATVQSPLTLEIHSVNPNPVRLFAGMPACHIVFHLCTQSPEQSPPLRSVYEGADPLILPQLGVEFPRPGN